jgi:crossover junction endodeoxyribonuclease RuvC
MTSVILGIDIGNRGAIALITASGGLEAVWDMPCLNDGPAGRRTVNAPLLAEIVAKAHATHAFVEFVAARPGEGAVGAFSFGRSRGVIEGVCAALSIPVTMLTPPRWKRLVGIPPGKDGKDVARSEAIRRWPAQAALFALKKHDGRAESALIAVAGINAINEIRDRRCAGGDRDDGPGHGATPRLGI